MIFQLWCFFCRNPAIRLIVDKTCQISWIPFWWWQGFFCWIHSLSLDIFLSSRSSTAFLPCSSWSNYRGLVSSSWQLIDKYELLLVLSNRAKKIGKNSFFLSFVERCWWLQRLFTTHLLFTSSGFTSSNQPTQQLVEDNCEEEMLMLRLTTKSLPSRSVLVLKGTATTTDTTTTMMMSRRESENRVGWLWKKSER